MLALVKWGGGLKEKLAKEDKEQDPVLQYAGIGAGLGAAFGAAFGNVGLGVGLGIAIGAGIGAIIATNEREGRTLEKSLD